MDLEKFSIQAFHGLENFKVSKWETWISETFPILLTENLKNLLG